MNKRFARSQLVSNTTWLLYQLTETCISLLEFGLYDGGTRHGLDTFFSADRKERIEPLALSACQLFQECGMSKEDIVRIWDIALEDTAELEEIAEANRKE